MHAYPLFCSILSGVLLAVNKKMTAVTFYYQCCKGNLKKENRRKKLRLMLTRYTMDDL